MNEVIKTIKNRRSIRKYNNTPVATETIEEIVEAGRFAPTGGNCQSVHFTVITNEEILDNLREVVKAAFAQMENSEDLYISMQNSIRLSKAGNYVYDYNAPVLVVVSNVATYPNAMADSACALQNMMLAATSLGVGSCWINQLHWLDGDESVREILAECGIGREEKICGSLAIGNYDRELSMKERVGMKVDWVK